MPAMSDIPFQKNASRPPSKRAAGFFIVLCLLFAGPGHASDWQSVLTTPDGIQVFRKETGKRGLVEFRGIGVVDVPLAVAATVIFDTGRRGVWIEGLVESRILRWGGKDNYVEYNHIEMPVFFIDRDFVSSVGIQVGGSGKELIFRYKSSEDPSAPKTGFVRGEVLNMTFRLSSIGDGSKTRVDAAFLCDPKGWIPAWLVNYFLQDWPLTTFRNLRKEVLKPDIVPHPRILELMEIRKQDQLYKPPLATSPVPA